MLCSLLAVSGAHAEEKAQAPTKEENTRQAKSTGKLLNKKSPKGIKHFGKVDQDKQQTKEKRSFTTTVTNTLHHVWVYSVDITMYDDPNHNGYFNRLVIDFDVDTSYDSERVYAVMSLTDSNGVTTDYFTTDDFTIHGESDDDTYQVDTVLTSNWPTDGYDLTIHILDAYSGEVLTYIDKLTAPELGYLTLESLDYEYSNPQYMSVFDANVILLHDGDSDGFYQDFDIELDVDLNFGAKDVYAEIYISDDNYHWDHLYTSNVFHVEQNSALDTQLWHIELLSGYPKDHYHLKVFITDAEDHLTIMEISPDNQNAFWGIPLEDSSYDRSGDSTNPPPGNDGIRTSVSSESGGSFGGIGIVLATLAWIRRKPVA